jgi:ASCH domain
MNAMRALSVGQPWAELIACGKKRVEVRSSSTSYRGRVLVCAARAWSALGVELHGEIGMRGVACCIVDLVDVRPLVKADAALSCVPWKVLAEVARDVDLYAWVLRGAKRVEPVRVRGRAGLFVPAGVPRRVLA